MPGGGRPAAAGSGRAQPSFMAAEPVDPGGGHLFAPGGPYGLVTTAPQTLCRGAALWGPRTPGSRTGGGHTP